MAISSICIVYCATVCHQYTGCVCSASAPSRFLSNQYTRIEALFHFEPQHSESPEKKYAGLLLLLDGGTQLSNLAQCNRGGRGSWEQRRMEQTPSKARNHWTADHFHLIICGLFVTLWHKYLNIVYANSGTTIDLSCLSSVQKKTVASPVLLTE